MTVITREEGNGIDHGTNEDAREHINGMDTRNNVISNKDIAPNNDNSIGLNGLCIKYVNNNNF